MISFALLVCFVSLVSSSIVQSTPEPAIQANPETFPPIFMVPSVVHNTAVPHSASSTTNELEPEPHTTFIITCRNNSCVGDKRRFSCIDDNGSVMPAKGHTLLLSAESLISAIPAVYYQATIPSSLVESGFLFSVPWRSAMNKDNGGIRCIRFPRRRRRRRRRCRLFCRRYAFGKPFGFERVTGTCCSACSFLSPQRSRRPRVLCCGIC